MCIYHPLALRNDADWSRTASRGTIRCYLSLETMATVCPRGTYSQRTAMSPGDIPLPWLPRHFRFCRENSKYRDPSQLWFWNFVPVGYHCETVGGNGWIPALPSSQLCLVNISEMNDKLKNRPCFDLQFNALW